MLINQNEEAVLKFIPISDPVKFKGIINLLKKNKIECVVTLISQTIA